MFRLTKQSAIQAIKHFPKMSSTNYSGSSNWSMPKVDALAWGQRTYPPRQVLPPLQSSNIINPSHSPSHTPSPLLTPFPTPISPSTNKSHIESYDQWFERRLNDKPDDMFLL